jgi:hypothetical protein
VAVEIDRVAERREDDRWTAKKLIALGAVTLIVALAVIWTLASTFAPPGYH